MAASTSVGLTGAVTLRSARTRPFLIAVVVAGLSCTSTSVESTGSTEGFGDAARAPITKLAGEIRLHQFPLGAHAWAAFLATPIAASSAGAESLIEYEYASTASEGPCTLRLKPSCSEPCRPGTMCLGPDTCAVVTQPLLVDEGELHVAGSVLVPDIRMWFEGQNQPYVSDPPPGARSLFRGGESLEVRGGRSSMAFRGTIAAPIAVRVTDPDLTTDWHLPLDGPLDLGWESVASMTMVVTIAVSSQSEAGIIRCSTADVGALRVPAWMIAALPRPPRDSRLEIERTEERTLPTATPGVGVFVRASQSTWKNTTELR